MPDEDLQGRGSQLVLRLRIWAILLDGRPHTEDHFRGLGYSPKQIKRVLAELSQVPIMGVYQNSVGSWLSTYVPKAEVARPVELWCPDCKLTKGVEYFYPSVSSASGYSYRCQDCAKIRNKEYRTKNRDRLNRIRRKYYRDHKAAETKRLAEYREEHREEINKRRRARWAIQQNSKRSEN